MSATFAPRLLHPGAWWLWALGLATAAARTTNPLLLLLIAAVAGLVVSARRVAGSWSRSYTAFLKFGLLVIVIRVVFEMVFGATDVGRPLVVLPQIALPSWMAGVQLGGVVTWDGFLLAVFEGMRLAAILMCVGAANSLVNPSRLLRIVPAALYEAGVAVVVCMTVAPTLVTDAARIRRARRLRGRPSRGLRVWGEMALPLFSGALERSVSLAASMDARGYGRTGNVPAKSRHLTSALVVGGLLGVLIGLYGLLQGGTPGVAGTDLLGWPMLIVGAALASGASLLAGGRVARTRYRPDPWRAPEWLVTVSGLVPAVVFVGFGSTAELLGPASPPGWPALPVLPALAVLVAALPVVVAPPLPRPTQQAPSQVQEVPA